MSEWRTLNTCCTHCGRFLQARPKPRALEIVGCESMEYRHDHNQSLTCTTTHNARPYQDWGIYNQWQNASASLGESI
jgi:hypothetical protein